MADKKSKPGFRFLVFLLFSVGIFTIGFSIGRHKEEVFSAVKKVVPPLIKKVELKIKGLFGIDKNETPSPSK